MRAQPIAAGLAQWRSFIVVVAFGLRFTAARSADALTPPWWALSMSPRRFCSEARSDSLLPDGESVYFVKRDAPGLWKIP